VASTGFAKPVDDLVSRANSMGLASDLAWLALLHYREDFFGGYQSDADDAGFFLSYDGTTNPSAELDASVRKFFSDTESSRSISCQFPARRYWLAHRLGVSTEEPVCADFETWLAEIKPVGVSLIFPVAYLGSPSSMFGHTFLRLDRENQTADNVLLDYTVNYAANTDEADNEFLYAYRGLFGGYTGAVSVQPYYEKVKEYRDMENRDIWEFRLNLDKAEVAQLVRHVWEVKRFNFDYFFMTENCAYRLMSLLDVAKPGLQLKTGFSGWTIPVDTVRTVINSGLVSSSAFRPSAATVFGRHVDQLNDTGRTLVRKLADGDSVNDDDGFLLLGEREKARIMEVAYELVKYRAQNNRMPWEKHAEHGYRLLMDRSGIRAESGFMPVMDPSVRDDQGHKPSRIGIGFGYLDGSAYGDFNLRGNYHDLTDPSPGFKLGGQIKFLEGSLRFYEDEHFRLERFTAVSVRSLSPRDAFLKPMSWGLKFGAHRRLFNGRRPLLGYFNGELGWSQRLLGGLSFMTLSATFEAGDSLVQGVDLALGPRVGWIYEGLGGQGMATFSMDCYAIADQYCGGEAEFTHTVNLGTNLALQVGLVHEQGKHSHINQIGLSVFRYF